MNFFYRTLLLLLTAVVGSTALPVTAAVDDNALNQAYESGQRLFRLKSRYNRYAYEKANHSVATATAPGTNLAYVWIAEKKGENSYVLRNAATGQCLPNEGGDDAALVTTTTPVPYYVKRGTRATDVYLSWTGDFKNKTCLHENAAHNVVKWNATTTDTYSNWTVESATNINADDVRASLVKASGYATAPESGKYYRIVNAAYTDRVLTANFTERGCYALPIIDGDMTQVWKVEQTERGWTLKSPITEQYIINNNNTSTFYPFGTSAASAAFDLVQYADSYLPTFAFMGTRTGLHAASAQSFKVVGWYNDQAASRWHFVPTDIDDAAVAAAKANLETYNDLTKRRVALNTALAKYFDDFVCTQLKAAYAAMSDDDLRAAMTADNIPATLSDMAIRVKNQKWNTANDDANRYEQSFRIANFQAYSDYIQWMNTSHVGAGFAFSKLTNPTGISLKRGEVANIWIDHAAPAGTELKAELVRDFDTTGQEILLYRGLNTIQASNDVHIYIYYNITNADKKLADIADVKVHIEGGRVNGYFDTSRHTNADWTAMNKLTSHGFFTDPVCRMKSKTFCLSLHLDGVRQREAAGAWKYNGVDYGIAGVLEKWDDFHLMELGLIGADRFYDRFRPMLMATSNSSAGFLYATTYGIFFIGVGDILAYKTYVEGGEFFNGGNLWATAHETGHHYQRLFDIIGGMESSVNLFSNVAVWKLGSNVSRGPALKPTMDAFNKGGMSWIDIDLGQRMRMWWQLWLYYEELGHHPRFFADLCDAFRRNPMARTNGNTDLLQFARTCSDVAGEDLTEFFEAWGFFTRTGNDLIGTWGDSFYDSYYAPVKISINAADVANTKAHMAQYEKKAAANLFFIDDRIRTCPATHPTAKPGQTRWGTTPGVTPGNAAEVGDVGMYLDFGKDAVTAAPKLVKITNRTIRVTGTNAVGYKVYNQAGKLIFLANRHSFTLPVGVDMSGITVKVASGNGQDVVVVENGQVIAPYDGSIVDGIHDVETGTQDRPDVIYDLSGRRVLNPVSGGVYIVNGRRQMVR